MASRSFFKTLRVTVLLLVLFFVGMNSWLTKLRSTDWDDTLWVVVYPINGDHSPVTQNYIDGLSRDTFQPVEAFLASEAERFGLDITQPVTLRVAPQINAHPPTPPARGSTLAIMLWSLKLRYWAFMNDSFEGPRPDVQMYVVYYDPAQHDRLSHSLGLQKGLIGVVNAYAAPRLAQRNNVIIAHEFLHTVGADDKYDPSNNQPLHPHGYAEPDRNPLYPQRYAEIMGGRIPLSQQQAKMPGSLSSSRIGTQTAREIRWID